MHMANLNGVRASLADKIRWVQAQAQRRAAAPFTVNTGYRSMAEQTRLYNAMVAAKEKYGEPNWRKHAALAAKPGQSNHQHVDADGNPDSLAVDLGCQARDNAVRISLVQEAGLCTPVAGEPWHMEDRTGSGAPLAPITDGDGMAVSQYIIIPCPTGGYWELKRVDGGIANRGGAPFFDSMPGRRAKVVAPLVGLTPCIKQRPVSKDDSTLVTTVIGYWIFDEAGLNKVAIL
jgi:hypothetical protein